MGDFRSRLGWLDGLEARKLEMAFIKVHLGASLVLPLKRELPIKKKKKRKLDSIEGAKEFNHCWDLNLVSQIQARIEHDSEFRRELLKSSERCWSARAEDVGRCKRVSTSCRAMTPVPRSLTLTVTRRCATSKMGCCSAPIPGSAERARSTRAMSTAPSTM